MTNKPFLIFDAGGVLVFPDFDLLADIADQVGIKTSQPEIAEQHARLFRALDEHIAQHHQIPTINYFLDIFKQVTDSEEKAQAAFNLTRQADKINHIWTSTQPWVGRSLRKLQEQGYQMAVISNSDGRVDQILQELNLREYFEIVIDSFVVGVEKPDPRIFEIALKCLNLDPKETIYIGDIYYIDVWGANRAGPWILKKPSTLVIFIISMFGVRTVLDLAQYIWIRWGCTIIGRVFTSPASMNFLTYWRKWMGISINGNYFLRESLR
jgi:putative hydrolase of the HAD superfamily